MSEPDVRVNDLTKEVVCGKARVTVHIGAFGFVTTPNEVPFGEIPNLIAALHTAHDIAAAAVVVTGAQENQK